MTDQPKRGRGPGRPVLENLKNAGLPLKPGETTRLHRVRAPAEVNIWFASISAQQRGHLLAQMMAWQDRSRPAVLGWFSGPPDAGVSQGAASTPEAVSRPSGERLVLSGEVPVGLSAYALAVLADLERGGVLIEDGQVHRLTVGGSTRTVRGDTVYGLRRAGVLIMVREG